MNTLRRFFQIRQSRMLAERHTISERLLALGITRETETGPRRMATMLSFFIPGSGQVYRGHIGLGFLWLLIVAGGYYTVPVLGILGHVLCVHQAHSLKVDKDISDYVTRDL